MYALKKHQEYVDEQFEGLIPFVWETIQKRPDNKKAAITFQAPTGAGKTISIGSVLVQLVNGGYQGVPKSPVLFVSASPDLNLQTLRKVEKAYPILRGKITFVENDFNQTQLNPGHIYFINTQKLGRGKMLTKGDADGSNEYNFWEVWENACANEAHPAVLVIDESHQGMGGTSETIAKRLLQGKDKLSPAPLVIGMSATPSKFEKIIEQTHFVEKIEVPLKDVKESGLIKDTISIHYQGEKKGEFESILMSVAAKEYVKFETEWASWREKTNTDTVVPMMVVQVKDKIKEGELVEYATAISSLIDSIDNENSFAHNIPDLSKLIEAQGVKIHQVDPSDVQDDDRIQVFFVKESAAVGWDCPRAEVLLSYRPHKDDDYIMQMIGRMLRTPLAQRVEGSDILNSTSVILPYYDLAKVETINDKLRRGGVDGTVSGDDDAFRVSLNPVVVSCVDDECKRILENISSYTMPKKPRTTPVGRMRSVGLDLLGDKIIDDYEETVIESIAKEVNVEIHRFSSEINEIVEDLKTVSTQCMVIDGEENHSIETFDNSADKRSHDSYTKHADKTFGQDPAKEASKQYIRENDVDTDEAMLVIAAASYHDGLVEKINEFAQETIDTWLTQTYKRSIKRLSHEEQAKYRKHLEESPTPLESTVTLPEKFEIESAKISGGKQVRLPFIGYNKHLYSDDEGHYYHKLSNFETKIIEQELEDEATVSFYRNPSSGSRSLKIPYTKDGVEKVFSPDFITFVETAEGIKPSIIDPHGTYLEDALDKLQGLADYAERHGDQFAEIRAISDEHAGKAIVLEMTDEDVREHVRNAETIAQAYEDREHRGLVQEIEV